MPMVTKEMTNVELIALRNEIDKILEERRNEKRDEAIDNFHKAFKEIRELCIGVSVSDYNNEEVSIENFDDFYFEY